MGNTYRGLFKSTLLAIALIAISFSSIDVQARSCNSFFAPLNNARVQDFAPSNLPLKQNSELKVVTWNLLNFRIGEAENVQNANQLSEVLSQKYKNVRSLKPKKNGFDKSELDLEKIEQVFKDLNADIYVFQEVLGIRSLKFFVKKYLNDEYDVHLEKGNDERGIQIAFAVKKSLQVDVELQSHKHLRWDHSKGPYNRDTPVFSRDLPALFIRQKDGSNARASAEPDLVILGTHFKSKRETEGDHESTIWRTYQAEVSAKIVSELNERFNKKVPIMLTGDFNTDVMKAPETATLRGAMKDSLDLMGDKLTADDKVTHTFHPHKGRTHATQTDAQFMNEALASRIVNSLVYHYEDLSGRQKVYTTKYETKIYPLHFDHRKENPSDHMPIIGIYDMTK